VRRLLLAFAALCLTGCATLDGISFGIDLANAETTVRFRHGDGKTVLAAEQDGKTCGRISEGEFHSMVKSFIRGLSRWPSCDLAELLLAIKGILDARAEHAVKGKKVSRKDT
jgi:hypothetical protein